MRGGAVGRWQETVGGVRRVRRGCGFETELGPQANLIEMDDD